MIIVTSLAMTGSWIDPKVINISTEKHVNSFGVGTTTEFDVHPFESIAEDNVDRAPRIDENSCYL